MTSDLGSGPASSWNRCLTSRRHLDPGSVADEPLLHVPFGKRLVPYIRNRDFVKDQCRELALSRMLAATAARAVATDHEVGLEELRLVVTIPEKEWERLAEQCRALRDEMEASGKYLKSELMQVQAALCCVCDYTTRPELRAAAVDRVHSMFKRENKPPDADTNEAAEEEAQLKDHTTLDLMKRIKGAGGAS